MDSNRRRRATDPAEQALIRLLAAFPAEIVAAADKYDPARITRYCIDVATAFHRFYNACRILDAEGRRAAETALPCAWPCAA